MLRNILAKPKKYFGIEIGVKIDNTPSYSASTAKTLAEIPSLYPLMEVGDARSD